MLVATTTSEPGALGKPALHADEGKDGHQPHRQARSLGVGQGVGDAVDKLVQLVASLGGDTEEVRQLVQANDQGGCAGEPTDYRTRQEVHQEPQPQHAHAELQGPHHEGQKEGQGDVVFCARHGEPREACSNQQAVHRHRPHSEVPRGAEEAVDDLRNQGGVQPVHHRKPCNHGIGHALRNQHDAHGQSSRPVTTPIRSLVALEPMGGRKKLLDAHAMLSLGVSRR